MSIQNVKGFKDYLPLEAAKRRYVINKLVTVFEKFGFMPLETPTLEYAETLTGKYGEEERLIYQFETNGGDKVALKYDQTVPLARVIAQYGPRGEQKISLPFKRYQIQSAYRGENTQKGRYREFTQCDVDIIGVDSALSDTEVLGIIYEAYQTLGLDVVIMINDRQLLSKHEAKILAAIDKLDKIGPTGVVEELVRKGLAKDDAQSILEEVSNLAPSDRLNDIMSQFAKLGYSSETLKFNPTLVRGLDYYTGLIIEVKLKDQPTSSSLGGGGRWNKMIERFIGEDYPAVGFSVGLDRTIEALEEAGLLDITPSSSDVLVTIFNPELADKAVETTQQLRQAGIAAELWLDPAVKLEKQLKYADQKTIPYVVIIGPEEAAQDKIQLKKLADRTQDTLSLDEAIAKLRQ